MDNNEIQLDRNLQAITLEKNGDIENAIQLYELNVDEGFQGNHPYDRLAIIYRKRHCIDQEIRVLKKAIFVFEKEISKDRSDRSPKLEKFKKRLIQAQKLLS